MDCSFQDSQAAREANSFNECSPFITLCSGYKGMECVISMGESSKFTKS